MERHINSLKFIKEYEEKAFYNERSVDKGLKKSVLLSS